jgi:enamine deaminase RidA (YjgF/YER057c/UK114 family)
MSGGVHSGSPVPQGDYVAARRHGSLIYTAGMTPRDEGRLMYSGPVQNGQVENQREAVRLACRNALRAVEDTLQTGESIAAVVTMTVYVAAEIGFSEHSKVADVASAFLREQLGERGICSRSAVGVASLPGNAPVEIQLVAAV